MFLATFVVVQGIWGEDRFAQQKERWLEIAQQNMPILHKRVVKPQRVANLDWYRPHKRKSPTYHL